MEKLGEEQVITRMQPKSPAGRVSAILKLAPLCFAVVFLTHAYLIFTGQVPEQFWYVSSVFYISTGMIEIMFGTFLAGIGFWSTMSLVYDRLRVPRDEFSENPSERYGPNDERPRRQTILRLLSYVRPHWKYVVGVVAAILATAALDLTQPWIIGFLLFNGVLGGGDLSRANLSRLPQVIFLLGLTFGLKQVGSFFQMYLSELVSQKTIHKLRSDVYQHTELMAMSEFDMSHSGDLVSRVLSDTREVEKVMEEDVDDFAQNAVTVAGAVVLLFFVDQRLTLLVLPVCLALIIVVSVFRRTIKRFSRRIREAFAELTSKTFEVFSGIRVVKGFRLEDHQAMEFRERSLRMVKAKMRLARMSGLYGSSVDVLMWTATVAVIWLAPAAVVNKTLALGALVAFLGYLDKMFKPLVKMSKGNLKFQQALAAADRVFELVDRDAEDLEVPGGLIPPTIKGRIEFDRVSFGYRDSKNVLRNFSLLIHPGETVAIVGSSGAGKSTVVNLLMRFYEPTSGTISIDGYPITLLSLGYLRSRIGLVLQEPTLFSGTIRENIKYGKLEASDDEIVRAAEAANAHKFIDSLPEGYNTEIGERGVTLSVGQRQRIAIARALLKDPSILIFDEATSNIDSESESLIQDALRGMARGRTLIVIGHRLSSIIDADRIVVLEDGRIAEEGTHEVLLSKGGIYNRLYEAQMRPLTDSQR